MADVYRDPEIHVITTDTKGQGGAYHDYIIAPSDLGFKDEYDFKESNIYFQNGPIRESGVNGCTNESLLEIVKHRLECFQSSDFRCRENAIAITKIEEAIHWLNHRTRDRIKRGVEGRNEI